MKTDTFPRSNLITFTAIIAYQTYYVIKKFKLKTDSEEVQNFIQSLIEFIKKKELMHYGEIKINPRCGHNITPSDGAGILFVCGRYGLVVQGLTSGKFGPAKGKPNRSSCVFKYPEDYQTDKPVWLPTDGSEIVECPKCNALREVKEELNVDIPSQYLTTYKTISPYNSTIPTIIYIVNVNSFDDESFTIRNERYKIDVDSTELSDAKWIDLHKLPKSSTVILKGIVNQ